MYMWHARKQTYEILYIWKAFHYNWKVVSSQSNREEEKQRNRGNESIHPWAEFLLSSKSKIITLSFTCLLRSEFTT